MKTIFSYLSPYKWLVIIALLLMLVELSVELVQPLLIATIIDDGILAGDQETIIFWGMIMLGISAIAFLAGITNTFIASHVVQSYGYDIRQALFKKVQSFTMATFIKFPSASLITRLTNDVTITQNVIFMGLRIMLRAPLLVIGSIIMSFFVHAYLAMFLVMGAPILILFLYFMSRKGLKLFGKVQKSVDQVTRKMQENLQAVRLIKAYLRGHYESTRFASVADTLKIDNVKAFRIMELILPVLLFVMNVSLMAVLWFGAKEIQTGTTQMGDLVAIVNYAMRMTGAFSMFSFIIIFFSRAKASAERMEEVLVVEEGTEEISTAPIDFIPKEGEIEFQHVSFHYPSTDTPVLKDVSFSVKSGEKLAIMGATGSGKSTLLNLIPRFFDATEGEIWIDGVEVKEWPLKELRQAIGLVPQQSILFTGSIEDNLGWGDSTATEESLKEAAIQAQIHQSIEQFPHQYDTRVGQKGVNLSGGQKQRLSIARALVRKPEILLLDDSTSALDISTENALWEALEKENATMLVITQKIRTAKGADHILLLEEGEVSAYGTHEQLMESSSLYREIAESQQEGGEPDELHS
ncbi:ABC transporter ATP-binding protein [Psychrobacillus lasiicapitis]|uniref:ABC transporter ATP-binding protein n=1 Tax=Psychrobacillus lasiicapitis TaxID=1636719 RepID=A0A544TCA0_9BACI|nr:ABC transporter ATP-binding protein [Psychrobacillus lasiicapitis]TQR15068.1 ABC transporter ATP-binding protein [Psychrobacillus lasiicapitis]GGA22185.1 putative ABC transporter ATP-binding protein YfiB [Psychrobacillus lasiicapitis]